jgi:carbon-monoxide dehydrogenase medium subunit
MQVVSAGLVARSQYQLPSFQLSQPGTLDEACRIMAGEGEAPIVFAGGTDIFAAIREGLEIEHLLSIGRIPSLRQISIAEGSLRVGALVAHEAGCIHPLVREHLPGLADAWQKIATVRIRMAATLGGNLMARRRRYEGSILMSAHVAHLHFATPAGEIRMTPSDLWQEKLPARAILTAISIPLGNKPRFSYDRSLRPIVTLGATIWEGPNGLSGQAVIATERLIPYLLPLDLDDIRKDALAASANEIAARAFSRLPVDFKDEMTGNSYLRKAGTAMLARRITAIAESGL